MTLKFALALGIIGQTEIGRLLSSSIQPLRQAQEVSQARDASSVNGQRFIRMLFPSEAKAQERREDFDHAENTVPKEKLMSEDGDAGPYSIHNRRLRKHVPQGMMQILTKFERRN